MLSICEPLSTHHYQSLVLPADKPLWEVVTLILTAVCLVSTSIFSWWSFHSAYRRQFLQRILDENREILRLSIQYPYFENKRFCDKFSLKKRSIFDRYARYDSYCCLVFNCVHELWEYCDGNAKKMDDILSYKEYVDKHKTWWQAEVVANGGYDDKFSNFIQSIIHQ